MQSFCVRLGGLYNNHYNLYSNHYHLRGIAVAQWLRCCATNRKVAGSIPAGIIGIFHWHKNLPSHYGPGVDSVYNRNKYQEYFLAEKAAGA